MKQPFHWRSRVFNCYLDFNIGRMGCDICHVFAGVSLFVLITCTTGIQSVQDSSESPLNLPCKPYRAEISFPVIDDASGHMTSQIIQESSPRDLLHIRLKWRRRVMELILYKNDITSTSSISEWEDGNVTYAKTIGKACFYDGYIKGQSKSYIALSTCGGLRGYLQTYEELLFIDPRDSVKTDGDGALQAHILYTCEPASRDISSPWQHASTARHMRRRRRRAAGQPNRYLEVQVVVDHTMVKAIGSKEKTEEYVMALLNIANTVFQHKSLEINIKIVVVKMIFLSKQEQRYVLKRRDAYRTVNLFCQWSVNKIPRGRPMYYDISVLITKDQLGPSGYAPITGLCNPIRSCAAVHDEGFTTGFVVAHEMAHVFGLFHDGHGNNCHGTKYQTSIMAAVVESKLNHYWWSECSKRRMHDVIRFLYCLNNKPKAVVDHFPLEAGQRLQSSLGAPWSLDFQCKMEFGEYFLLCNAFYNDPCSVLWCSKRNNPNFCRTKRGPPLSGSVCGRDKECHNDQCQYVGNREPVDGKWSAWSDWSECSNGCGVGVKQRSRSCDNPSPMFNGKECEGEQHIWESCYNMTCTSFQDIREGECDVWDSLQIKRGTHKWVPFEPVNASTQCKQTCKSSHSQEVVTVDIDVADGAPCSYLEDTSDICMSGKCQRIGCDGQLNSTKKRDACGICGGEGTECKVVQGTFTLKPASAKKYLRVVTLPPGSKNISISQLDKTFKFLALKDVVYGKFLLNGNKKQRKGGMMLLKGAMFNYSHSGPNQMEVIKAHGPLKTKIDVLVLPNARLYKVAIAYSYTVHKSDYTLEKTKYKWKFEKWSPCSVTCGSGIQTIVYGCQDKDSEEMVEKEKCAFLEEARKDQVKCTRPKCSRIRYNFAMKNEFTECNAKCGQTGSKKQLYLCERVHANRFEKVDMKFCRDLPKPNIERKCKGDPCQNEEGITHQWGVSKEWSKCHSLKECGISGKKTRLVRCVAVRGTRKTSNETVDDSKCDSKLKPESTQSCQTEPCPVKYQWVARTEWSECPCGKKNGIQKRNVTCEKSDHDKNGEVALSVVEVRYCHDLGDKLTSEKPCEGSHCPPSFKWKITDESEECIAECDETGIRKIQLACEQVVEWEGKKILEIVSDSFCNKTSKPNDKNCQGPPCKPVYQWKATNNWTDCEAKCGETANRSRIFMCESSFKNDNFTIVKDIYCSNVTMKLETKECNGPLCPLKWQKGSWSQCSVTCGRGKRYRKVYCGDADTDTDDYRCTDKPPLTSRRCELAYCPVPKVNECRDMFSFCTSYPSLKTRCMRARFKKICCKTCKNHHQKGQIIPPQNALEQYMKKRGLGRWQKRSRR